VICSPQGQDLYQRFNMTEKIKYKGRRLSIELLRRQLYELIDYYGYDNIMEQLEFLDLDDEVRR